MFQAKSALQVMIECSKWSEDIPSFLALAAQMAFEVVSIRNSHCNSLS